MNTDEIQAQVTRAIVLALLGRAEEELRGARISPQAVTSIRDWLQRIEAMARCASDSSIRGVCS